MIEICGAPALGRVAVGTIYQRKRRARRRMHWIVRLLPSR